MIKSCEDRFPHGKRVQTGQHAFSVLFYGQIAGVNVQTREISHNIGQRDESGEKPEIRLKNGEPFPQGVGPKLPDPIPFFRCNGDFRESVFRVKTENILFDKRDSVLFRQKSRTGLFRPVRDDCTTMPFSAV